jgi:hypothetical protein
MPFKDEDHTMPRLIDAVREYSKWKVTRPYMRNWRYHECFQKELEAPHILLIVGGPGDFLRTRSVG